MTSPSTTPLNMRRTDWALLLLLSLLWGGSFFFAKIALSEFPPLTLVFLRVALAGMALGLFIVSTGQSLPKSRSLWAAFAGMGLLNNLLPFTLLFWGQTQIGAGLASIFNALVPVFTVILAHFYTTDEKLSPFKLLGVGFGAVGVAVLIGIDVSNGINTWTLVAMLACLAAALSYGFASVYGRRFHALGAAPMQVAFGQVSASAAIMLPVVLWFDRPLAMPLPGLTAWMAVLSLALVCTAFAYVLFFKLLATAGATSISLVAFLIPVSAITLGTLFLGERLALNHLLGIGFVFAGLAVLNEGLRQRFITRFKRQKTRSSVNTCIQQVHTATNCSSTS